MVLEMVSVHARALALVTGRQKVNVHCSSQTSCRDASGLEGSRAHTAVETGYSV